MNKHVSRPDSTLLAQTIQELTEATTFVDTHEHLWAESHRIASVDTPTDVHAPDFGMLLGSYAEGDLLVAGMPPADHKKLVSHDTTPGEKWKLFAPWYDRCRHTGYLLCVHESVRALYGEDDLREDNFQAISDRLRLDIRPGFYHRILREVANIEYAQVNDLNGPVIRKTFEQPELFSYDLWTIGLGSGVQLSALEQCSGAKVGTLTEAPRLSTDVLRCSARGQSRSRIRLPTGGHCASRMSPRPMPRRFSSASPRESC